MTGDSPRQFELLLLHTGQNLHQSLSWHQTS
uniref:Uncharacterized protein n=1 Tax=Arundo donax TaxID=35708 RepID=A0A0A9E9Z9_ARUDO